MVMTDRLTGWHRPCHSGDQGRGQGSFYHCQCPRFLSASASPSLHVLVSFSFTSFFRTRNPLLVVVLFHILKEITVANGASVWCLEIPHTDPVQIPSCVLNKNLCGMDTWMDCSYMASANCFPPLSEFKTFRTLFLFSFPLGQPPLCSSSSSPKMRTSGR